MVDNQGWPAEQVERGSHRLGDEAHQIASHGITRVNILHISLHTCGSGGVGKGGVTEIHRKFVLTRRNSKSRRSRKGVFEKFEFFLQCEQKFVGSENRKGSGTGSGSEMT